MKRYRTLPGMWDGRAVILNQTPKETWDSQALELYKKNTAQLQGALMHTYGALDFPNKLERFKSSGYFNMSIVNDHNSLLVSVRDAYVMGHFYPALTSACTLGERILNDLVLKMRDAFKSASDNRVYKKEAFTSWKLMVDALKEWEIIGETEVKEFRRLKELRNFAVHYDPNLKQELAEKSKEALAIVGQIIYSIFSATIPKKYRIPDTRGVFFIKKNMEDHPFIKEYFLPHCIYVGPNHKLTDFSKYPPEFTDEVYTQSEISDEEFAKYFL